MTAQPRFELILILHQIMPDGIFLGRKKMWWWKIGRTRRNIVLHLLLNRTDQRISTCLCCVSPVTSKHHSKHTASLFSNNYESRSENYFTWRQPKKLNSHCSSVSWQIMKIQSVHDRPSPNPKSAASNTDLYALFTIRVINLAHICFVYRIKHTYTSFIFTIPSPFL